MKPRKLPSNAKHLMTAFGRGHGETKAKIVRLFEGVVDPKATSFLLRGLGDPEVSVRSECARILIEQGKAAQAVEAFSKVKVSKLPKLEAEKFWPWQELMVKARQKRMADLRKAKANGKMTEWRAKYMHRGMEIYLVGYDRLASNFNGRILINKSKFFVPEKFRHIMAEHEYFEYVNHELALAAELIYAKKHGLLEDYLKWEKKNRIHAYWNRVRFANKYLGWHEKL